MTQQFIRAVDPDKVYRIFNIGATTLVSASHEGKDDVMAAAWATALDLVPAKATVVIDRTHYTRKLMDASEYFSLQIPTAAIVDQVMTLGTVSKNDDPEKLEKSGAKLFRMPGYDLPLVEGCAAWVIFRKLPEADMAKKYDLFLGEAVAAWADERVFKDGHWLFESAPEELRTLHYVAGGHFYKIGDVLDLPAYNEG